jgi:hypothetical protein
MDFPDIGAFGSELYERACACDRSRIGSRSSWTDRARRAAIETSGTITEDSSFPVQLLAYIRSLFRAQHTDRLSSETMVQALGEP